MAKILFMVVPCYNEQEVITETTNRLAQKYKELIEAGKIAPESKVICK